MNNPNPIPRFTLSGKDKFALPLLRNYLSWLKNDNQTDAQISRVEEAIGRFNKYRSYIPPTNKGPRKAYKRDAST